ncbi:MAG: tRNA pseudouridine(38-40) synthase TruA [Bacteroidales bacterium]|nr:tRNA pseudouridine(38-40) synthase TruA [Bacteroidales bacterium]MDP3003002.1 tRNA pseudouridine(38-40) synthase TruA [Bacteroidales bacterium]
MKTRYFIFISYKGTYYHGWQIQPNSVTVQKVLDDALSVVLSEKISTIGAGRTDAGVHAMVFCAHFDSISPDLSTIKNLIFRLNRYLPDDISVNSIKKVVPDANARYSVISRTYKYYISKIKEPFFDNSSWFLYGNIHIAAMNEACKLLFNHSDFTSFSRLHSNTKTKICKIYSAVWEEADNRLVFTIKADRFLRNMVRAIAGTMVEIGFGKMNLNEFEEIILAKDRCRAGKSAPAKGLFLADIEYPEEIFV